MADSGHEDGQPQVAHTDDWKMSGVQRGLFIKKIYNISIMFITPSRVNNKMPPLLITDGDVLQPVVIINYLGGHVGN
jgi:hypothetical protein